MALYAQLRQAPRCLVSHGACTIYTQAEAVGHLTDVHADKQGSFLTRDLCCKT